MVTKNIDFIREYVVDNISFSTINKSSIHGFGLFSTSHIKQSTIMGNLDGQVIDWNHYDHIVKNLSDNITEHKDYLFMEWNALDTKTLLVRPFRTKYSYINHSYTPNLEIRYNPIRVVALKNINENEEYTLDYSKEPLRKDYLDGHGKTYL